MTFPAASPVLGLLANLLAAALLGGIVGVERQASHKPAGFRTHLLVSLGACAFMEISRLTGDSRIAAGVITGVGFLGAGAIVREGLQPRGLTTAASIWAVASIGLALGLGTGLGYALASVTTVLTFATLAFSDKRLDALFPPRDEVDLAITLDVDRLSIEQLSALFEARGIHAKHVKILLIERVGDARQARVGVQVHVRHSQRLRELIVELAARPEIARISTSEVPPT